ncbi:hypothetical protein ES708_17306 [subsurface metagenome]
MASITRQVLASSDDCRRWYYTSEQFSLTSGEFEAGASNLYPKDGSGARFPNITIPKGATIENGTHLTLRCRYATDGVIVKSRISADDVDDALTFSTVEDFDTRYAARTTARVNWDSIPAWTVNVEYDSPEIKSVIQEIVNRAGWVSGQALAIFWEDFEGRSSKVSKSYRRAYSYNGSVEFAPKLVIAYTPPVVAVGRSFGFIIG